MLREIAREARSIAAAIRDRSDAARQ